MNIKKVKKGCGIGCLGFFVLTGIIGIFAPETEGQIKRRIERDARYAEATAKKEAVKKAEKEAEKREGYKRSAKYQAQYYIKALLNDPASYEFVSFYPLIVGDLVKGEFTYRAKNVFGGVVTSRASVVFSCKKDMLESVTSR